MPENTKEDLTAILRANNLFQMLDADLLEELTAELTVMTLLPGQTLVKQGAIADSMYVVLDGQLVVVIEDNDGQAQFRRLIGVNESIGEIALLTGQTRTATVIAQTEVTVFKLTKASFEQLSSRSPIVANRLADAITDQIRRRQLRTAFTTSALLKGADPELQHALEAEFELLSLRSGERLFQQGDPGASMYLVVSGRLKVVLEDKGKEMSLLRELGQGESLGEIALLTEQPRTASVYAIRDTEVAKLSRESYERLVIRYPTEITRIFTRSITDIVVSRDRRNRLPASTSFAIALVPVRPDVLLPEFAQRLKRAFDKLGPTLHVNHKHVDKILGKAGAAQTGFAENNPLDSTTQQTLDIQLVNWLSEQETNYRFLLYEADATLTPWSRRAVRQADHILFVAHGGSNPSLGELEIALTDQIEQFTSKPQSLVLLHRADQRAATGTVHWLTPRNIQNHYHIRWHSGDHDFARLARILGGEAVGLVLSGGAVRGAAHLGVLRAIEEAHIPIDLIGGVSSGSIVAGLYVLGYDLPTIQQRLSHILRSFYSIRELTPPAVAFLTGNSLANYLQASFGDVQIEDLYVPFFCGSANLSKAQDYVHSTGTLWKAVRASSAVPGMLPPFVNNGDLLIDGGLYNNLPLDIMRLRNPNGKVIGVDVIPAADLPRVAPYEGSLSGWMALYNMLAPWKRNKSMPNIATLLYRTLEVSSVQSIQDHLDAGLVDLYLCPPISHYSFLEVGAVDEIAEIGYSYAKKQLADWEMMQAPIQEPHSGKSTPLPQ